MAPKDDYEPDILVNGTTIASVIDGMEPFGNFGRIILANVGLSEIVSDTNTWYSQELWLKAFNKIAEKVGIEALFEIGTKIPENAKFPPVADNIVDGLRSINVAYHLNHMNVKGEILFDKNRDPPMLEGIGHYIHVESELNDKSTVMKCQNPYPCDFDRGIIQAIANKFNEDATVNHLDRGCRKEGSPSCSYLVEW